MLRSCRVSRGKRLALYVVELMACGLLGEVPPPIPRSCAWNDVWELVEKGNLAGVTWHGVRNLTDVPAELRGRWERAALVTMVNNVQLAAERDAIGSELAAAGMGYMPLKGSVIAPLYPALDMRSMSDVDILYGYLERSDDGVWHVRGSTDEQRLDAMRRAQIDLEPIMTGLGYAVRKRSDVAESHDTMYVKPPFFTFEMHHALVEDWLDDGGFFDNPWAHAHPSARDAETSSSLSFSMSLEDRYLYHVVHALKHERYGGLGIRFLADWYVLLAAMGDDADHGYIRASLESIGAASFEREYRDLVDAVFSHRVIERRHIGMLVHMVRGGTFGSAADHMKNDVAIRRRRGAAHPRLDIIRYTLSVDRLGKTPALNRIAASPVLRPLYPVIKFIFVCGSTVRHPVSMGKKLGAFLRGRS